MPLPQIEARNQYRPWLAVPATQVVATTHTTTLRPRFIVAVEHTKDVTRPVVALAAENAVDEQTLVFRGMRC